MKFRLVTGSHSDLETSYNAGDVIESDINLVETFGPKFEIVYGEIESTEVSQQEESTEESQKVEDDNVTDQFDLSDYEEGIAVHKRKRKYFVSVDGEELNDKGLNKRDVPSFVSDYFG